MGKIAIIVSPFLALLFTSSAFADTWFDPDTGITWAYEIDGEEATIGIDGCSAIQDTTAGVITIPATLGGCTVTRIGGGAFVSCTNLTGVTISEGVADIASFAFCFCQKMKSVSIPSSVTNIGAYAFAHCSGLTTVTIPANVMNIGACAFCNCLNVQAFHVDADNPSYKSVDGLLLSKDGTRLIEGIDGDVTIPSCVTSIEKIAFYGRTNLMRVTIPSSVTNIDERAFDACTGIRDVVIPACVTNLSCTFPSWQSITNVVICEGVVNIANHAFSNCVNLMSVTIPESVRSIGHSAFYNCRSLPRITIPASVKSMGVTMFYNCASLGEMHLLASDVEIALKTGSYWTGSFGTFDGCTSITNITLSSKYKLKSVFPDSYDKIVKVAIPFGCTEIVSEAYSGCTGLKSVVIPDGVTSIGSSAFSGCLNLASITIPSSVTSIDGMAFYKCTALKSMTFLGDAPDISDTCYTDGAFYGTPRSMIITVPSDALGWTDYEDWGVQPPWGSRLVVVEGSSGDDPPSGGGEVVKTTSLVVVSNVVVHYVRNSVESSMATPITTDTGIVNVMTEITGGNVAIPESWATNYTAFAAKFGDDFTAALTKPTGKYDSAKHAMMVWQDYVAGTDPTNEKDVFRASITVVGDQVVVSYTPELSETEKDKRIYTTLGKVKLTDDEWVKVPAGSEADYNFFKVTVEMK